jgi:hypothetical protein
VILALRGELGGWGVRGFLSVAVVLLLYRRLGGICGDMERLVARFQAGRLWRVDVRAVRGGKVSEGGGAVLMGPGRFGWLVRAASYHAAGFGSQLRAVLVQPEMVALLVAVPQAARILRPLCRMLAVETSLLRPVAVAGTVAVVSCVAVPVRVRREPPAVERIDLPRGVLLAARRQGFGKIR